MDGFSRRELLGSVAGAGVATLAGCSDVGPPEGGDGSGDEFLDSQFVLPVTGGLDRFTPENVQFNPYDPRQSFVDDLVYDPLAVYDHYSDELRPRVAESFDVGEEVAQVTLREDYVWSNGDPVTATDVARGLALRRTVEDAIADQVADWRVVDDRTIELTRATPGPDSAVFEQVALTMAVDTPRALWSGDEGEEELYDRNIIAEDAVTNGAYVFDEVVASRQITFEQFEEYANADQVAVPEVGFQLLGGQGAPGSGPARMLVEGGIDYHPDLRGVSQANTSKPLQRVRTRALPRDALWFNQNQEPWGDQTVRRAFAHAVDLLRIGVQSRYATGPTRLCGLVNDRLIDRWLGDLDGFADYGGTGSTRSRAAELFRQAGLQQEDGTWRTSDGDPLSINIQVPNTWRDGIRQVEAMASDLQDFGVQAEAFAREDVAFLERAWTSGDFDVAWGPFGASVSATWHPAYHYRSVFDGETATDVVGSARVYEVPATVGDAASATERIDAPALAAELETAAPDRGRDLSRRLAWTVNRAVPAMLTTAPTREEWYAEDAWRLPDVELPVNPPWEYEVLGAEGMLSRGMIQPREVS